MLRLRNVTFTSSDPRRLADVDDDPSGVVRTVVTHPDGNELCVTQG